MKNNEVKGTVDKITYRNSSNGYTVFKVKYKKEIISCVGIVPSLNEGDTVVLTGNFSNHSVYGEQFNVETIEISAPRTQLQVLKFLSSGAIKGIGPATAMKIVERFKENTLDIIENHPIELTVIKGISHDKATAISDEYKKQFGIRDIMLSLANFNISPVEATDIFKTLGVKSVDLIRENPYILSREDIGFSFERTEEIAENLGIPADNFGRLSAGIEYVLRKNLLNGPTCLPIRKLIDVCEKLLSVEGSLIQDCIALMCDEMRLVKRVFESETFLFLYEYYAAEEYIASKLNAYSANNISLFGLSELEIKLIEHKLGFEFDEKQIESVNCALENSVFVLTGGPGTGKTTTLNAIISVFEGRGKSIALAAPTGRAAKRITELTGYEAKTLHRLLEVEWGSEGKQSFARNKKRPLDEDIIIVDEMSMVDTLLFKALLEACRITSRIILIGDSDQLPSVGAGNVLGDIIDSGRVCGIKLDKIFRQSGSSSIVTNAHKVISGNMPLLVNNSSDFFFIRNNDPLAVAETIVDLVATRLPKAYNFSSFDNIQVLCPSKKLSCGSYNLNILLQEALNTSKNNKKQMFYKGVAFREGDKVMQTKNNYDIVWTSESGETGTGIINGDIGRKVDVDIKNRMLYVRFDDKVATYFEDDLEILDLAYAITVHKSQGSEFDCVVIPLCDTPHPLRYRNLIYTAITRAKKILVLVGNDSVLAEMIGNDRKTLRYSGLKYMLNNYEE